MYKLLISFDIPENKSDERKAVNNYIEQSTQWVHLQESVWVILSEIPADATYQTLRAISNLSGSFSVTDVTKKQVFCNDCRDDSIPDGHLILQSDY